MVNQVPSQNRRVKSNQILEQVFHKRFATESVPVTKNLSFELQKLNILESVWPDTQTDFGRYFLLDLSCKIQWVLNLVFR